MGYLKKITFAVFVATIASVALTSFAYAERPSNNGQIIIKLRVGEILDQDLLSRHNLKTAEKILRNYGAKGKAKESAEAIGLERLYVVDLNDPTRLESALTALNNDARVEYAEPNYLLTTQIVPNDPNFSKLWGMNNTGQTGGTPDADIDAPQAWDTAHDSFFVVGIIDTGIDYNHEDLAANMWKNPGETAGNGVDDDANGYVDDLYGWDWVNNDNDPFDDHGHGTHVSGTVGAKGDNGLGVVGVNWNVKLAALKFLSSGGSGTIDNAIKAVDYANTMGFKITSNSWGGGGFSQALYDAIKAANEAGNLFVAAAGNSGENSDIYPMYPAAYDLPNIISVAATDHNDAKAIFSNYGLVSVDLGAPGVDIYSSVPKGSCALCDAAGYKFLSGTSMATPHVSGAAALLWAYNPALNHLEVKNKILNAVDLLNSLAGITVSGGRLNLNNLSEADNIPPAAVADLVVSGIGLESATLTFTAVGDDGFSGQATRYDIRYSTSSIDQTNFDSAIQVSGEPAPKPAGSAESFKVNGLSENTTYYFALKVYDNAANLSGLSNVVSGTTPAAVLIFEDNMEFGINGWTASGLWHQETKRSFSPVTSWAYNSGQPFYNYDTGGRNSGFLDSPFINLASSSSAVIKFKYFYETEPQLIIKQATSTAPDQRWIKVLVDGTVQDVAQLSGDNILSWNDVSLDLSAYAGKTIQIRFFFDTIDSIANQFEGWYIDDVRVYGDGVPKINPDVIKITKATYSTSKKQLNVEATSSRSGEAELTVQGFGIMNYNPTTNLYRLIVNNLKPQQSPVAVTVISSLGGNATGTVLKIK